MDRSTAPFEINEKVVCIDSCFEDDGLIKDEVYTITKMFQCKKCKHWYVGVGLLTKTARNEVRCCGVKYFENLSGYEEMLFDYRVFRKINPYQSSVTKSLAERAVESIGDGQDLKPVKVKEVVELCRK